VIPVDFPQANRTFTKPRNMTDAECAPLRVHDTGGGLISCWRPTWRERLSILFRGRVWLWIVAQRQPPVALTARSPFVAPSCDEKDAP